MHGEGARDVPSNRPARHHYMRDRFNAPIDYDPKAGGYRFGKPRTGPRYELPGLWFNATKIYALLTTLHLFGNLQQGILQREIAPLIERLRTILGKGDHSWAEIEKRIGIFQPERREGQSAFFSVIAAALLRRRQLWIRHYNRNEDRFTERDVSPQRLVHYRDNWYLDAYCHLREDLRTFAVDAIREARLQDRKAREVPGAELDEHLGSGYGIFSGRAVQWATLRFSARAARWVSAQNWRPSQRSRIESDGSYVLEIPYAEETFEHDDTSVRPDVVIRLPGGRNLVVDAKTSTSAYLDALEATDEAERERHLALHAAQTREHVRKLAAKNYWDGLAVTPDFVVMFIPGENFYAAALERDPSLFEDAAAQRIIIASPATLIALAKAVAFSWRQEKVAENAQRVHGLGRELYKQMTIMSEHIVRCGESLGRSVTSFDQFHRQSRALGDAAGTAFQ